MRRSRLFIGMYSKLGNLLGEFRTFVLRGNVIDLAVGIVIGAAFQSVVTAFVRDLLTPIITIPAQTDFFRIAFTINKSTFMIGDFLNAFFSFLLVAGVVFFFVVRPINFLTSIGHRFRPLNIDQRECPYCISQISVRATRCPFCTAEVPLPPPPPEPPPLRLPFLPGREPAAPRTQDHE